MKHSKLFVGLTVALAATLVLAGCGSKSASSSSKSSSAPIKQSKILAVGSTALQPLVEQAAKQYQTDNPKAEITVQGGGSGAGLSQVAAGSVTIGNSDIFAQEKSDLKADDLVDHQVAVVAIAPVVNKDAGVKNISTQQLVDIFQGKITNWKEVGGKDQAIVLINRAQGSGTRATFEQFGIKTNKVKTSQEQDSSGTVYQMVSTTPGAISYLAFSAIKDGVQKLALNHVQPTDKNVTTNTWKIWAYEHMYTKGKPNASTAAFINYIQSKNVQKTLVPKLGYIPVTQMTVARTHYGKIEEINK